MLLSILTPCLRLCLTTPILRWCAVFLSSQIICGPEMISQFAMDPLARSLESYDVSGTSVPLLCRRTWGSLPLCAARCDCLAPRILIRLVPTRPDQITKPIQLFRDSWLYCQSGTKLSYPYYTVTELLSFNYYLCLVSLSDRLILLFHRILSCDLELVSAGRLPIICPLSHESLLSVFTTSL